MSKGLPLIAALVMGTGLVAFSDIHLAGAQNASPTTPPAALTPEGSRPDYRQAVPGAPTAGRVDSEAQVRQKLMSEGYSNVADIKRQGENWQAKAMKNGKQLTLNIDAKTGQVKTQ